MTSWDDEPVRVEILGVVGRLTCAQENEVYLRLLRDPDYIEANTVERVLGARRVDGGTDRRSNWELARRRSELAAVLGPKVAKMMTEVQQ